MIKMILQFVIILLWVFWCIYFKQEQFLCDPVLKLLKMARSVRALLDTVMQALPEVGNLGLLFFLLFFIFAALGVELFGRVGEWTYYNLYIIRCSNLSIKTEENNSISNQLSWHWEFYVICEFKIVVKSGIWCQMWVGLSPIDCIMWHGC